MAKRLSPIITYTEILSRAIRSIDIEIGEWQKRCENLPQEYLNTATEDLRKKRETLMTLYSIETGTQYE